ncbi:CBS domain-containing protein [Thalassobius sp. S69A]|uniref:CBS domain-containing protein n=1 Tax=unclassified Thalassovita TaxID=2619711 RepID=UPI000C11A8C8|nr:signal transduction protein [Paracoccaceae bacterium]MBT25031.1 signal transduction protein [Paracoccaceae bacterium]
MSTTTLRNILAGRKLHAISPEITLRAAAAVMAEERVGALAVLRDGVLVGILSERDIVFRAVARGLHSDDTLVREVMTADPVTVGIDDAVSDTLAARLGDAFRHLPVMDGEKVVGLLSYRDIPTEYVMMFERFREMQGARADQL